MTNSTAIDITIDPPITINGTNGAIKLAKNISNIMKTNTIVNISINPASSCACLDQIFVT